MNDLIVKNVDLFGDKVTVAKDANGDIWVGVRWLCQGLGMSEGQWKRQITNIKNDAVLGMAGSNLVLPLNSGKQPIFCLRNDYIPLWLAKINITPNIQKTMPDLANKLLNYQLKAKDILAAAFMPQKGLPTTTAGQIKLLAQGQTELQERIDNVSNTVDVMKESFEDFKESCPMFPVEAEQITTAVKRKGVDVMGGKRSSAYHDRSICTCVYRDIYGQIHRNFGCQSYKEIPRKHVGRVIEVIEGYTLPITLYERVSEANEVR